MQRRSESRPSSDVATFVLVHGGGHGGWCWEFVARELTAQGHRVFAPTLTGVGDKLHLGQGDLGLDTHIEDVLSLLWDEDLSDVVLVGHSYGGMVITGVADGAANRIRRLVYLDAAIPSDGEALLDISPGLNAFNDVREVGGVRLGLWPDPLIVSRTSASGLAKSCASAATMSASCWRMVSARRRKTALRSASPKFRRRVST